MKGDNPMCFSAQASFGSALFLTGMGVVALSQTRTNSERFLAGIPLLFALQQATEGVIWITEHNHTSWWHIIAPYLFLGIASAWPTVIPLAVWLLEKNKKRAKDMLLFLGMGIIYTLFACASLALFDVESAITQHVAYNVSAPDYAPYRFLQLWYLMTVALPPCLSTMRYMWLFGVGSAVSLVASHAWQTMHVASIWCFFAALMSSLIVYVLYVNKKAHHTGYW